MRLRIWPLPLLILTLALTLTSVAVSAQQLTLIISGGPTWNVPEAREVLAGVAGRPKTVIWSLSSTVGELSFDLQRGRANPAPGQPFRGSAVTVRCKRAGNLQLKAEPTDPAIQPRALNITCKAGQTGGGAGGGGNNEPPKPPDGEPHTFGWQRPIDQRAMTDFRLPAAGQARGKSLAEIINARYPGPYIRSDQGRCSGCHRAQYANDHARSGGLVLENISRQNFCNLVPSLLNNPRASFDNEVRNFFEDWHRRGCPN